MQWDTICMDGKKLGTYKNWVFTVRRDPSKHTMYKLNAYGFNAEAIKLINQSRKDAEIRVVQVGTSLRLHIPVSKAVEVWTYLSFNWELQLFIPKDKFTCNLI